MFKFLLLAVMAMVFAGCAGVDAKIEIAHQRVLDINATYGNAKQVYIDSKHVLYEINEDAGTMGKDIETEKEFWKNEAKTIKETL